MKIVNYLLVIGILIAALSCSDSQPKDKVALTVTQDSLRFMIPDDVKGPMLFVETLEDSGKAYLSFKNEVEPEILFYEMSSGNLVKRVVYAVEGDNAITGGFMGYHRCKNFKTHLHGIHRIENRFLILLHILIVG